MKIKFPKAICYFALIHLLVAIPLAYYLNIWADEASTLYTTKHGVWAGFQAASNEKQAPLYFILLSLWRLIDSSVFFARVFSVICSVLSIGSFFVLIRRLWNEKTAIFATFFFSVHPYLFWASNEIRPYALVILFSVLLVLFFESAFLKDETGPGWSRQVFTIIAVLAFSTNYYIGFLLVGLFVSLLFTGRFRPASAYFLRMLVVLLCVSPLLLIIINQIGSDVDGVVFEKSAPEGIRRVWNHLLTFAAPTELFPPEEQTWISFGRLWLVRVLILAVIGFAIGRRKRPDERFILFGIQAGVVCAFLLFSYFLLGKLYVEIRHAVVLFVPLLLFLLAAILELAPRARNRIYYFGSVMVVLIFFYSYGLTALYPEWAKRGDWTRVANYVETNEKPGQPVVVFRNYEALAFIESYDGKNRVFPEERYFDWKYEGAIGTPAMWSKQIEYVTSVIPKTAPEVWLVTEERCHTGEGCLPLENYVKENYTVLKQKDFYKERVRLLRKK